MKTTRRGFLLAIPAFFIACTGKKKMSDEEAKKLQQDAANYHNQIDKKLISEGHPIASTFKYKQDATQAPADIRKERAGTPANEQFCDNCLYYKKIGEDYGSCQMLPQGNVTAKGWCFAWVKQSKPATENL
jgi:hypothetical protein